MKGRRIFMTGGLGVIGISAFGYGGSLAACRLAGNDTALLKPLLIGLGALPAPDRVGSAWLERESAPAAAAALLARRELFRAAILPDDALRKAEVVAVIQADFAKGDVVVADRFVISRTEARLAVVSLVT